MQPRVYLLVLAVLMASACAAGGEKQGPEGLLITFNHPRPGTAGVAELWVVAGKEEDKYLLHAWDVERRRTRQVCGEVPPEVFATGWEDLEAAGLLVSGEDLRLIPSPGSEPFAGRFRLRFRDGGRRVSARRPLSFTEAGELIRVLRSWEATLHPTMWTSLPPELRVEMGMGGCSPPEKKRRRIKKPQP